MNTKKIVYCALFSAIGAIMSAFLSIEIPIGAAKMVEVSLAPVCVILAGILFGSIYGAMTGFVADTAGFFMGVQHGAYNPVFSITMALYGVIAGLLLYRKKDKAKAWGLVLLTCTLGQVLCSIILNTLAINLFYGVPIKVLAPSRIPLALVELPIYFVVIMALLRGLLPYINKTEEMRYVTQGKKD